MYDITIYPNTIAPWFSQVFAGLYELQKNNKAKLTVSTEFEYPELVDGTSLALDVKELGTGKTLSILIDLSDNRNLSKPKVIDWFDVIVKRSYYQPQIDRLPQHSRHKIIPYGINLNCGSPEIPILRLFTLHHLLRLRFKSAAINRRRFKLQHQLRFLFYLSKNNLSLHEADFMGPPDSHTRHDIFFVTRLFESPEKDLTDFSRERIELVKALKKEFGSRYHGGIVRNQLSEYYCPKNILYSKISRRQFTTTLKESDIVISTLGVGESNPWKLGEAMASSRCIVSEPLRFELPVPLKEGKNIITFKTIDDCLIACEQLLGDPELVRHIKEDNWNYYNEYIKAERLIERALIDSFLVNAKKEEDSLKKINYDKFGNESMVVGEERNIV